ncbi:hypothetical protein [Granulicella sp. S156]|jgi:hypothetical protein|uniref:hypothetical protein n=1 Tax=Granulicella sp. S156 TaxID=1747224 RepID=UPI00131DB243|nr:hypothetical protein [Granulicella sp. S156]
MVGESGKYYRSGHIARSMGDWPREKSSSDVSDEDRDCWDDRGGCDGKCEVEKMLDGYKCVHHGPDGTEEREHPDLRSVMEHLREVLGSDDDEDDLEEEHVPKGLNRL